MIFEIQKLNLFMFKQTLYLDMNILNKLEKILDFILF